MFSQPAKIVLMIVLAFVLAACGNDATPTTTPVPPTDTTAPLPTATHIPAAAIVNGEIISIDEFKAEVERYKAAQTALGKTISEEEAATTVLNDLIAQVLLAQGATKNNFTVDEAMLQARIDNLTAEIGGADTLSKWQADHGYTSDSFSAALRRAIAAAWMRDQVISQVPISADQVHVRQILFYNEERARTVLADIQAGRTDFDEFAALVDPAAHGDLGWFPKGYLAQKAVEQAAFALGPDQVSDVLPTELGFHVIKVLAREKRLLSPDALLTLQEKALQAWVEQQKTQSKIVIAP